uniref:Putative acyltransferase required for palmitoylation of hedgehog hh family of secreted signaling n=1 Tax=Hyalomma excavatum TaxID=257692 RepID=A0A131XK66_9ACAR
MAQKVCADGAGRSMSTPRFAGSPGHSVSLPDKKQNRCPAWTLHWCIWTAAILYAMASFATSEINRSLPKRLSHLITRSPYWGFTRKWDTSDQEWREARQFFLTAWPWLLLHSVIGRGLTHAAPSLVPYFHAAYSLLFLSLKLGWLCAAIIFAEHAVFFALACLGVPALCYGGALFAVAHYKVFQLEIFEHVYQWYGRNTYYVTVVAFYWAALKCLSFCMDHIWRNEEAALKKSGQQRRLPDYWKTLAYILYLPPLVSGPLQNYDDFDASLKKPKPPLSLDEIKACVLGLLRSAAHFFLVDIMYHYFYSSALVKAPYLVPRLNLTCLVGFGVTLNIMFFVKYLVIYGVPCAFARVEGVDLPAPPKCVARSHLCSHFWRYFDHGLHLWIRKYLYQPILGPEREVIWRLLGTALAFSFVWLWHDMTVAVTFWASLNFLGIALEVGVSQIRKLGFARNIESKYMDSGRLRFVKAVLGSPHYLLTIFSCLFFLTNMEIATIFFKKVILGFPLPMVPVLVCLYFGSQTSLDVMEWEDSSKDKEKAS